MGPPGFPRRDKIKGGPEALLRPLLPGEGRHRAPERLKAFQRLREFLFRQVFLKESPDRVQRLPGVLRGRMFRLLLIRGHQARDEGRGRVRVPPVRQFKKVFLLFL
jgi:hypothetical protein